MIAIGVICSIIGLGTLCWLLFTFATLAFPLFVAVNLGFWLHASGFDAIAVILLAATGGVVTLGIGQLVFASARWSWLQLVVGLVYVVPAGVTGYWATLDLMELFIPAGPWRGALALGGAAAVGATALAQLQTCRGSSGSRRQFVADR